MRKLNLLALTVLISGLGTDLALAQNQPPADSDGLTSLKVCRALPGEAQRLACYDRTVDQMGTAQASGDLVVVERSRVQQLQTELFGFAAPAMSALFRGGEAKQVGAIETTLERAYRGAEGRWRFQLADGGLWEQVDHDPVRFVNQPGQEVRVRRASLGSYMLTTGNSRAVRVQRR